MIGRYFGRSAPAPLAPAQTVAPVALPPGNPIRRVSVSRDRHERQDLRNRRFDDLNANKATFVDCDFSYCIFERAYLHRATFERCRFTGSRFYDSNLTRASFHGCDLRYATFHRTLVDPAEMLASLPLEPNLRRDSLRNLRANAVEIGHYRSQRHYVLAEIDAAIDHYRRATRAEGDYYRSKYPRPFDRLKAWARLTGLRIGGLVWGHGERPFRMLASAAVLILALTLLNFWSVVPRVGWQASGAGLKILKYSVDQLLDAQPDLRFRGSALIDYLLIAMRYLYIGLFISVLARSASHR